MAYTNEELSRRKKPSAIKKKKALDAALERLKKKRASLKEGEARFDKLVKAIKQSQTSVKQDVKLKKIAAKVRGIREMVSKMRVSDYRSPGRTYDIKSKEVKDNQLAMKRIQVINYQGNNSVVKGLEEGDIIVNQNIANAYPGMPVKINQKL